MSGIGTWGFGTPDDAVSKPYPAYTFLPTENGGKYSEMREIAGDLWLLTNAQFNTANLQFYQPNPPCDFTQNANALVFRAAGQVQRYTSAPTNSGTVPVSWGTPYWQIDPTGSTTSLGPTRTGLVNNVPADGSAAVPVLFTPTPFTQSCTGVVLTVLNPFQVQRWLLSAQYDSPTQNGFNLNVSGAPGGSQVSVFYLAVGV